MHTQSVQLRVSLTGRYATALFEEAEAQHNIEIIMRDINLFKALLKEHHDLDKALKSQLLRSSSVVAIIDEIGNSVGFSSLFVNFLKVISANRRYSLLEQIIRDFLTLVDHKENTLPVRVEVVSKTQKHLGVVETFVKNMYPNRSYRFEYIEIPELLGGFRAFINERCLDYSLQGRLNRLLNQLKEA